MSEPLKTSDAARRLGLSKSRIRQYANSGTIAVVRDHNGHRLLDRDDVERLRKVNAAAAKPIGCAFCGTKIPQHRVYCDGEDCRRRRQRIRWKRSQARREGQTMTRAEHIAWAKERALEYVAAGDNAAAFTSFLSDLGKHAELGDAVELHAQLGTRLLMLGHLDTAAQMREWLTGFI